MARSNPKRSTRLLAGWPRLLASPKFATSYMVLALVVLAATVLFWASRSAAIQNANADQLSNAFLFRSNN